MEKELLEAFLLDVKQMVTNNPNDVDLGKTLRIYFNNLPDLIKDFKQKIDKDYYLGPLDDLSNKI